MAVKKEELKKGEIKPPTRKPEDFGKNMYIESAKALRTAVPRIALTIGTAILIWIFGNMVFIPIAQGINFFGYPVPQIISSIIIVALAILILTIFADIRHVISGLAGVLAFEVGKASGETRIEAYKHYRTALNGVVYVVIVSLTFMLFSSYLTLIHPAIPAAVLIAIVIWAIFSLWRASKAVAAEIARAANKAADELEKRIT